MARYRRGGKRRHKTRKMGSYFIPRGGIRL